MLSQQQADGELIKSYAKIVAMILVFILLAYFGIRYFGSLKQMSHQSIQVEHTRLLNVLAVVRSQWLSTGKPETIKLTWQTSATASALTNGHLTMAAGGWPIPDEASVNGCRVLLMELLGQSYVQQLVTQLNADSGVCRYVGEGGASISYQTGTGRVIFLTGSINE